MLYTLEKIDGAIIHRVFPMIEATTIITMSETTGLRKLFEKAGPDHRDALANLTARMPTAANAVLGVKVATATTIDGEGRILLVMTYTGTPVFAEQSAVKTPTTTQSHP
jgi:uncharacterized protein YbjQ (UPF0145 family)